MTGKQFDKFWRKNKSDLVALLKSLKPKIQDDYGSCDDEPGTLPNMQITISINKDCTEWSYQTGDNSYSGGCYCHPYWGVGTLFRRSNSKELAKELIDNLADQIYFAADGTSETLESIEA